ncbi:MAG: enoyl-CoA hydratase/carnithine racemase [Paracoccaceae bacterium]|jgi:enoyl-CoA hydratase/carnithine racemase
MEGVLGQIETCSAPTIAALNGFVTGGAVAQAVNKITLQIVGREPS